MTLLQIVVDMSQEKGTYHIGQAYVVFSHVTQLSKLYVANYNCQQIYTCIW